MDGLTNFLGLTTLSTAALIVIWRVVQTESLKNDGLRSRFLLAAFMYTIATGAYYWHRANDVKHFHNAGVQIASNLWQGDVGVTETSLATGTPLMETASGFVILLFGGHWVVFLLLGSTISWLSSYALYRAFKEHQGETAASLAALLLFFLPSLVYWTSIFSKDTWSMGGIALFVVGAGIPRPHRPRWSTVLACLGIFLVALLRPKLALILAFSLALAVTLQAVSGRTVKPFRPKSALVLWLVFTSLTGLAFQDADSPQDLTSAISEHRQHLSSRTHIGGSAFEGVSIDSPLDFPQGTLNVLFRPYIWEATNPSQLAAAVEAVAFFALISYSLVTYRKRRDPRSFDSVLAIMSLLIIVGGILGLSDFRNLGIVARQRIQVYPFLIFATLSIVPASRLKFSYISSVVSRLSSPKRETLP